ncbi:MAG: YbjN domain-containing protein [Pseudomonadota bacterium]|nr:YbjN domain-containing protein [Pseudomonadota bacterium]
MSDAFNTMCEVFRARGEPTRRIEGEQALAMKVRSANGGFECYAGLYEAEQLFTFQSFVDGPCPEPRRAAMQELLTRANFGMFVGAFELDLDDGEIRFKTAVDFRGDRLSAALVRNAVETNWLTMTRHLPAMTF